MRKSAFFVAALLSCLAVSAFADEAEVVQNEEIAALIADESSEDVLLVDEKDGDKGGCGCGKTRK